MLILSRKRGERVCLTLEVDVIWRAGESIGSNSVKLGIHAPKSVDVFREELAIEQVGSERWTQKSDTTKTR